VGARKRVLRISAGAALVALFGGIAAGCSDDGPSSSDVSDNIVQACAEALGLDPDDFSDFSDVDDYDELTDAVSDEDFDDDFTDEFTDNFTDEFSDFNEEFEGEFTDEFTEFNEATDVDEQLDVIGSITDSDAFGDLFGAFQGCEDVVRTLVVGGLLDSVQTDEFTDDFTDDFTDFTDDTGTGDFTDDSGSGS
jgi:hypothetical protein